MAVNSVLCLHVDKSGRLWAGSEGGGLYLYDRKQKLFAEKNRRYNISGDLIASIEEDGQGNLWMGTNTGLVQLYVPADEDLYAVRVYTTADGLLDNFFLPHSACRRDVNCFSVRIRAATAFPPPT